MTKPIPISEIFSTQWLEANGIVDYAITNESRPQTLDKYKSWLDRGEHGPLKYMADHRAELREDIKNFFPEFQSGIVFLFSYKKQAKQLQNFYQSQKSNGHKLASYVLGFDGDDYHYSLLKTLNEMKDKILSYDNNILIKHSLDIQPVLERDLAFRSGLGWFGKNSMIINRDHGSYLMLGSLFLSKETDLPPRELETDHCGNCRACVEACPTDAINESERSIISERCISTFTIETFKDAPAPDGMVANASGEFFGCDICQIVCPWNNRKSLEVNQLADELPENFEKIYQFFLSRNLEEIIEELEGMSNRSFVRLFKGTAMARTGRVGLLKNLKIYS